MKILAIDSSAVSASAAILDGEKIIGRAFVNVGLTHSQTLMPMIESVLRLSDTEAGGIDAFAVTNGPGSFTGVRIGVATVKGLAAAENKPCIGVSTLEAMAYNFIDRDCIVCPVMDARCSQVYTAFFKCEKNTVTRLTPDDAIPIVGLENDIKNLNNSVILVGDGAEMCYNILKAACNVELSCTNLRYQDAVGTAFAALSHGEEFLPPDKLEVKYLRMPQAERELKKKELLI
ncbi:MAG: tRNA (adenosine(37)-N6)-threonylcarbamoyltransferase complex dimerization subunit type 1 TsaB [Clostridiales bacterium]|nr:tRNA (adenosine(37)-N6)-threonylcarbamoyltransferase complex dimerization subunit type 1 TsaB [Clostridiales bacterium]